MLRGGVGGGRWVWCSLLVDKTTMTVQYVGRGRSLRGLRSGGSSRFCPEILSYKIMVEIKIRSMTKRKDSC